MGMNRPSIYRAFGNKEAIYPQAMAQFRSQMQEEIEERLVCEADFRKGLSKFYQAALEVYLADDTPRECIVMCTAQSAALIHSDVQADLQAIIEHLDAQLMSRVELAIEQGQLSESTDANSLSKLIQAILQSIAIRFLFQLGRVMYDPTVNGAVVSSDPSLTHHLLNIPAAQCVRQIPANALQGHSRLKYRPLKAIAAMGVMCKNDDFSKFGTEFPTESEAQ
jgi:AcrR family transcriptional regulator